MPTTPEPLAPAPAIDPADPWLRDATVLDHLSPAIRAALDEIGSRADYAAGEIVMRDGAATPFLGVLESGRVGLRLHVPERGPQTIVTLEPGELIGWSAIVAPYRATAEAVALEPTRILTFEAAALRALLEREGEVGLALLPVVLGGVSQRLVSSWQQLLDLFAGTSPDPW